MAVPQNIGIKAIELYFPSQCVDQADLEKFDGVSPGKYTIGLGQTRMSFCDDREDIYSLALTTVSSLLHKYSIDPRSIGRLEVGTETILDKSKSVKSVLMQLFAPCGNTNVEGVDTVNACYGGTNALFNTLNWVESSAWDGRDAIVVAGDIALYKKGNARPTGGAACVAMLIGPDAPLAFDAGCRGSYIVHAYDFYKPDLTSEYPIVDGQFSLRCYTEALDACYKAYSAREATLKKSIANGIDGVHREDSKEVKDQTPIDRFDHMCFHAPTCKVVVKSYARLLYDDFRNDPSHPAFADVPPDFQNLDYAASVADKNLEKLFIGLSKKRFVQRVQPSVEVPTMCGNMYCASVYGSLCSLLSNVSSEQLQGKRVGIFSYGSGLASSMFSLKVKGSTEKMREKLDLHTRLEERRVVKPEVYDHMCNLREKAHLQKSYKPAGSIETIFPGTYYLTEIDDLFKRSYEHSLALLDISTGHQILDASAKHPQPGRVFQYGTAGFRMKADLLDSVVFRVGLLAALRSRKLNGKTIGVMITASHNPPDDNGVKLVDPMGEMLESSWEAYATELANAASDQSLLDLYNKLASDLKIRQDATARVIYARDTRASGPALVVALQDALNATNVESVDYGTFTTPQLHYVVRCINTKDTPYQYGQADEEGYYLKLSAAFKLAIKHRKINGSVIVDCANGVGGPKMHELMKHLPTSIEGGVDIKIVNDDVSKPEMLNVSCGADYVKTGQRAPPSSKAAPMERCASFDGDADRIVYYFIDNDNKFCLLDGDRIATLAASFLGDLGRQSGLADSLKIGVVQTAYANGASTDYITKSLNLPVICTPTGVKHLHHAATRFDIGVYFEANGHGTVLFSSAAQRAIRSHEPKSPAQQSALETLKALNALINQTVGDAISDLLLVEVILAHKTWSPKEWENTYRDLPNRLVKVEVKDKSIFKTVDAERKLESPRGVQAEIDKLVGRYKSGRAFARASGTEDAMRVYAEASTRGEADDLAQKVGEVIKNAGR